MGLFDRCKMTTATTGTGTISLGSASSRARSFATAGVPDGAVVPYAIEDGLDWEVGYGTYTASGTTLTRGPTASSNANAAISLSGYAEVFITPLAKDFLAGRAPDVIVTDQAAGGPSTLASGFFTALRLNTFLRNEVGASISSNSLILGVGEWYLEAYGPFQGCASLQMDLYNTTDSVRCGLGEGILVDPTLDNAVPAMALGFLSITSGTKGVSPRAYTAQGGAYSGRAAGSGAGDRYLTLKAWRHG